jgi:hypothetical protein
MSMKRSPLGEADFTTDMVDLFASAIGQSGAGSGHQAAPMQSRNPIKQAN